MSKSHPQYAIDIRISLKVASCSYWCHHVGVYVTDHEGGGALLRVVCESDALGQPVAGARVELVPHSLSHLITSREGGEQVLVGGPWVVSTGCQN